jgi:hypothetical protein
MSRDDSCNDVFDASKLEPRPSTMRHKTASTTPARRYASEMPMAAPGERQAPRASRKARMAASWRPKCSRSADSRRSPRERGSKLHRDNTPSMASYSAASVHARAATKDELCSAPAAQSNTPCPSAADKAKYSSYDPTAASHSDDEGAIVALSLLRATEQLCAVASESTSAMEAAASERMVRMSTLARLMKLTLQLATLLSYVAAA